MKLTDELSIAAPLSKTWPVLLDVPTVTRARPGAAIDDTAEQGEYRGRMKVKLGPVTAEYTGVARLQEVDDDDHVARYHVVGREARGQGSAEATITIGARDDDGGTRLRVETELAVTGRQAQLGRGVMEEVASGILREFVGRLESTITGEGKSAGALDGGEDVFDAGAAVYRPLLERAAILLAGVLFGLGLGRVVWRR
jgi:carbon monoxide dehydrogenase subunit G